MSPSPNVAAHLEFLPRPKEIVKEFFVEADPATTETNNLEIGPYTGHWSGHIS